jgi:hypothetical protein
MSSSSTFGSAGQSPATIQHRNSCINIFFEFMHSSATRSSAYGHHQSIEHMPTATLNSKALWEDFANFLASEHVVKIGAHKGEKLGVRTARGYFSTVMRSAKDECSKRKNTTDTIRFVCAVLK